MSQAVGWHRGSRALAVVLLLVALGVPALTGSAGAVGTIPTTTSLSVDSTNLVVGALTTVTTVGSDTETANVVEPV